MTRMLLSARLAARYVAQAFKPPVLPAFKSEADWSVRRVASLEDHAKWWLVRLPSQAGPSRISDFGLLSDFGLRPSDFRPQALIFLQPYHPWRAAPT